MAQGDYVDMNRRVPGGSCSAPSVKNNPIAPTRNEMCGLNVKGSTSPEVKEISGRSTVVTSRYEKKNQKLL